MGSLRQGRSQAVSRGSNLIVWYSSCFLRAFSNLNVLSFSYETHRGFKAQGHSHMWSHGSDVSVLTKDNASKSEGNRILRSCSCSLWVWFQMKLLKENFSDHCREKFQLEGNLSSNIPQSTVWFQSLSKPDCQLAFKDEGGKQYAPET